MSAFFVKCIVVLVLAASFVDMAGGNELLDIYERDRNSNIAEFPFCKIAGRMKDFHQIGATLTVVPCTKEPFYYRLRFFSARDISYFILPFNTFLEGTVGNFFDMARIPEHTQDRTKVYQGGQYIGPVSSHIYPPKPEHFVELPGKMFDAGTLKVLAPTNMMFDFDISGLYEFPEEDVKYKANLDIPMYFSNSTHPIHPLRYFASSYGLYAQFCEECYRNVVVKVNPVSDVTTFKSCDDQQKQETLTKALAGAKQYAVDALSAIEDALEAKKSSIEIIDFFGFGSVNKNLLALETWFGKQITEEEYIEELKVVLEKFPSFVPSVFECRKAEPLITQFLYTRSEEEQSYYDQYYYSKKVMKKSGELEYYMEEVRKNVTERIEEDPAGVATKELRCTPGMLTWVTPRDQSHTIRICPDFFEQSEEEAAIILFETIVRFEDIANAKEYVYGPELNRELAQNQLPNILLENTGSYSNFIREISNNEIKAIVADI